MKHDNSIVSICTHKDSPLLWTFALNWRLEANEHDIVPDSKMDIAM